MTEIKIIELTIAPDFDSGCSTYLIGAGVIKTAEGPEHALLQLGWLQGEWHLDILYFSWFKSKREGGE